MKLEDLAARQDAEIDFQKVVFDYRRSTDQDAVPPVRHPVVIVGAGPVGLSLAIDLAQRQVPVVLLDNDDRLSTGSRAICFAKRTLEIFDRLGCGERITRKGVSWNVGRVFFKQEAIYSFDLLPESGHQRPAFVNLQQYYVEGFLAQRAAQLPLIDLRWKNKVTATEPHADHTALTIETPDGSYRLEASYVAACDGSRSAVRQQMGLESKGRTFKDRFLIADVRLKRPSPAPALREPDERLRGEQRRAEAAIVGADDFPAERWFWFDPDFHPNQSVLLHRQPDGVWRIDFQLGWDADPEEEKKPENILPRVKALLAHSTMKDSEIELEWASVYTFSCLRMDRFRHGRVLFAGDSAHGVSPFGARGANSGVQDAENLAWKLAAVLRGLAPDALLDSYADEREYAADENIRNSTRATDFITPKSEISRVFRDAVLNLARGHAFARTLVNSGRLSVPATLLGSALNTTDDAPFEGRMCPGAAAADAPLRRLPEGTAWLLRALGEGFTLLTTADDNGRALARAVADHGSPQAPLKVLLVAAAESGASTETAAAAGPGAGAGETLVDRDGLLAERYDLRPGTAYLIRPDQHISARWRKTSPAQVRAAIQRALAAA